MGCICTFCSALGSVNGQKALYRQNSSNAILVVSSIGMQEGARAQKLRSHCIVADQKRTDGRSKKLYDVEFPNNLSSSIFKMVFLARRIAPLMKGSWQNVIDVFCPNFTRQREAIGHTRGRQFDKRIGKSVYGIAELITCP